MIKDAVKTLSKVFPDREVEGYWKIGRGFILKLKPLTTDKGYYEELLFYVEDSKVEVTNPMEHPVIINKPMINL